MNNLSANRDLVRAGNGPDLAAIRTHGQGQEQNDAAYAAFLRLAPSAQAEQLADGMAVRGAGWAALARGTLKQTLECCEALMVRFGKLEQMYRVKRVKECAKAASGAISELPLDTLRECYWQWSEKGGALSIIQLNDADRLARWDSKANPVAKAKAEKKAETAPIAIERPDAMARAERAEQAADESAARLKTVAERLDKTLAEAKQVAAARDALQARVAELERALGEMTQRAEHAETLHAQEYERAERLAVDNNTLRAVNAALERATTNAAQQTVPTIPQQSDKAHKGNGTRA